MGYEATKVILIVINYLTKPTPSLIFLISFVKQLDDYNLEVNKQLAMNSS